VRVAEQETVVNGSARLTKQVADALFANLVTLNLRDIPSSPALPEGIPAAQRFTYVINTPLAERFS